MVTKIKFISFTIFLMLFVGPLNALNIKGDFFGVVKDKKTGIPIEGASVYLADIKAGSSTNKEGFFKISNITDGKHLVEISHLNYATIIVEIEFTFNTRITTWIICRFNSIFFTTHNGM